MGYDLSDITTATPTECLISGHGTDDVVGITIASGAGVLSKCTVVAQYNTGTSSGHYARYDNSKSDGRETAKGILADKVDATSSGVFGLMYVHGHFHTEEVIALDSGAVTDLKTCVFESRG